MRSPVPFVPLLLLAVIAALGLRALHSPPSAAAPGRIDAAALARTFTFAPETLPSDRQLFLQAVASARPQARRLIDIVDGLVSVDFAPAGPGALGVTEVHDGHFDVTIDLAQTYRSLGMRGVD